MNFKFRPKRHQGADRINRIGQQIYRPYKFSYRCSHWTFSRKWTPEEDDFLKEVINNYKSGDSIPWSTGK